MLWNTEIIKKILTTNEISVKIYSHLDRRFYLLLPRNSQKDSPPETALPPRSRHLVRHLLVQAYPLNVGGVSSVLTRTMWILIVWSNICTVGE